MSSANANNRNKRPRQQQAFDSSRRGRPNRRRTAPPPPPPKTCSECSGEQPKYKCPKCREPYCSIVCCRKHKEKDCEASAVATKDKAAATGAQKSKYLPSDQLTRDPIQNSKLQREQLVEDYDEDLDEGWKITKHMMDEMDKSDWLRKELQDGGLRQLIHEVYGSSRNVIRSGGNAASATTYQEEALANLQSQYPNFRIFLEKLKVMTGILERQQVNEEEEEDLSSWLEYTRSSDDVGPLALKPLPSREEFLPPPPPEQAASSSEEETSSSSENGSSSDESDASSDASSESEAE